MTAGPPGVTGYTGGRAKPRPVLAYWPTTVSRTRMQPQVDVRTAEDWAAHRRSEQMTGLIRLAEIAHARSGDKGNHANIGVIAFREDDFHHLGEVLTETRVAEFFLPLRPTEVQRYALPGIHAYNFVLKNVLGRRSQPLAAHRQPGQDAGAWPCSKCAFRRHQRERAGDRSFP